MPTAMYRDWSPSMDDEMDLEDKTKPAHLPAQHYALRVPSPPRIFVPPRSLKDQGASDINLVQRFNGEIEPNGFDHTDFLKSVRFNNVFDGSQILDWQYEQRRSAQKILPFLYLGPMSTAKDRAFLSKEVITMVLAVRSTASAQARLLGSRAARELGIEVQTLDVANNQQLIAAFPRGIEIINAHLSQRFNSIHEQEHLDAHAETTAADLPGRVLVFCESGNERSATLVVAYVMAMFGAPLLNAIQFVQGHRFAVAFDDPTRHLLATYESILRAQRDILHAQVQGPVQTQKSQGYSSSSNHGEIFAKKAKRPLDETDTEDDKDMAMDDGVSDFQGRSDARREGRAPFQDT